MTHSPTLNIFAYGSNLHRRRMIERVPSARPLGIGFVDERRLRFHKRSVDGSAKADAIFTGMGNDRVWGAVYQIRADERRYLDQFEFLGIGYDLAPVSVSMGRQTILSCWLYEARAEAIDADLSPYRWYVELVREGAQQHRLPYCYVAQNIVSVTTLADPNDQRRVEHQRMLEKISEPTPNSLKQRGVRCR